MKIKYKKLIDDVIGIKLPEISGDVGYDLYASEDTLILPWSTKAVKTGIAVELPEGFWLEIMPKSGLAFKNKLFVHNGVIDNGYRGEIIVQIYNFSDEQYCFKKNEKIAQCVIRNLIVFDLESTDSLSNSKRQENGFGSTGK